MMANLKRASNELFRRPAAERFETLTDTLATLPADERSLPAGSRGGHRVSPPLEERQFAAK
jgi:hypothetical protein